ncbi:DUF4132 domain-containing protein [uncultured Photobacterium sp.]|uniref:DUF4132 domain-containing protein n=1 Tax=uncultured Photobacterium sp. TaxID=173973 RepID=UPI00263495D3|nr:DUF4132 domain-containing protein [uncultured Photobacterium sp.]
MKISDLITEIKQSYYISDKIADDISEFVFNQEQPAIYSGSKDHFAGFYIRNIIRELKSVDDDALYIQRFLAALLSSASNFDWLEAVDIDALMALYPDFHTLLGNNTEEILDKVFTLDEWDDIKKAFFKLSKIGFPEQEVRDFLQHEKHKSEGFYNYSHHLYLKLYLQPKMREAYDKKDCAEFDAIFREYFTACLQDHNKKIDNRRDKFNGALYRTALPQEAFDRFVALFDGTGDWEADLKFVTSQLATDKDRYSSSEKEEFTLLHDEEFKELIHFILDLDLFHRFGDSKYVYNFSKIILGLDIETWIDQLRFFSSYNYCAFKNANTLMEELDDAIKLYPALQTSFIQYLMNYISQHYHCCLRNYETPKAEHFTKNPHLQLLKLLCERFGATNIWDWYYNDNPTKPECDIIHGLLAQISDAPELSERKDLFDQALLRKYLPRITKKEQDNDALLHFILTGENADSVAKVTLDNSNIEYLSWLSQPYFERLATIFFNGKNNKLVVDFVDNAANQYQSNPLRQLSDVAIKYPHCEASYMKGLIGYTQNINKQCKLDIDSKVCYYEGIYYPEIMSKTELAYLQQHNIPCVKYIAAGSASVKALLLICLKGTITDHDEAILLIDMLKEKQKGLNANLQACISSLPDALKQAVLSTIAEQLEDFSGQKEINAVECLCQGSLSEEIALDLLNKVSETQSRTLLIQHGNINFVHLYKTADGRFDLAAYLAESYQAPKKMPVSEEILNLIETKDGSSGYEAAIQLLQVYQHHEAFVPSSEGKAILSQITEDSLDAFMCHLISQYADSITAKNRWLLTIPTLHTSINTVKLLMPLIERWANGSKHQLAAHLIKQMGGSGLTQVFMALDRLSRNTKKQSVKEAIQEAFAIGASQKGITKGELGDSLVDNIGFVDNAIPLSYCGQDFDLILNKELKFSIRKPDGKIVKSLPKPKVDDDAQAAAAVSKHFTDLKKMLKDMVTLQTHRLEDAFVVWRQWQYEKWAELFLANPVMNKLASQLVWGIYEQNTLTQTFTVNPAVITVDDEALDIAPNSHIGLVHPSELTADQLAEWQDYFADWEISVLFDQLSRPMLTLTPTPKDPLAYVPNLIFRKSPSTVINRLRKKGWAIGSVRDGGSFDELYKEIDEGELGIEITFDEAVWHGGYGYESDESDIAIDKIEFYQAGALPRGSYCYAELDEPEYKKLKKDIEQLPLRLVQELVREAVNGYQ